MALPPARSALQDVSWDLWNLWITGSNDTCTVAWALELNAESDLSQIPERLRQKDILSLRPAWATYKPCIKTTTNQTKTKQEVDMQLPRALGEGSKAQYLGSELRSQNAAFNLALPHPSGHPSSLSVVTCEWDNHDTKRCEENMMLGAEARTFRTGNGAC